MVDPLAILPDPAPGFDLGVSVSFSPDLDRLGLTDTHVRMALGEVARAVLVAHGRISYGGHLRPDGYTDFLVREVERYGSRDRPFTGYVPWPVHRSLTLTQISEHRRRLGLLGRYVLLDPDGQPIADPSSGRDEPGDSVDADATRGALSAARTRIASVVDAQLVLGGQRTGFAGRIPGIVEETICTIRAGKPIFVAGGFGGVAGDVATALGLDPEGWLEMPDRDGDDDIEELRSVAADEGWSATGNGLAIEQVRQLAVSYRASEIASIVANGVANVGRSD